MRLGRPVVASRSMRPQRGIGEGWGREEKRVELRGRKSEGKRRKEQGREEMDERGVKENDASCIEIQREVT